MTLPAQPPLGSTAWFAWASGVHDTILSLIGALTLVEGDNITIDVDGVTGAQTINATAGAGIDSVTIADLPAGSVIAHAKVGSSWGNRPTDRTDIMVLWLGADPAPSVVDPPAVNGMYDSTDAIGDMHMVRPA